MRDPSDPNDHANCVGWCEIELDPAKFACLAPIVYECDQDAFDDCFTMADTWCDEICSTLASCSAAADSSINRTCVAACKRGTLARDPSDRACMDAAIDICDMDAFSACFGAREACARMCNHAYLECGLSVGLPSGKELDWEDCLLQCGDGFWSPGQLDCLTTASCDAAELQACQPETCESLCMDLAACGSANPDQTEKSCLGSCRGEWSSRPGVFPCLTEAVPTCEADVIDACFPFELPACTAMCNHVYFECGLELRDTATQFVANRRACAFFCDVMDQDTIDCLTASECNEASVDACLPQG